MKKLALILALSCAITACEQEKAPASSLEIGGLIAPAPNFQLEAGDNIVVTVQDISIADKKAIKLDQQHINNITSWPVQYNLTINSELLHEDHNYSVSARITNKDNQLVGITDSNWSVTAEKPQRDVTVIPIATRNSATQEKRKFHAECANSNLITSFGDNFVILYNEGTPIILKQVRSASGARYANNDNELWNKADKATITLSGTELGECTLEPVE
ncbi:putative lipoprotein YbaY [Sinobacterium caligoides]|uniref:Putative lipoprotein YbaY n=1 Tax=Sinobacterium caligoides TaxID=933926 RepID=A0A3N2DMD9_9GAMM|nr:YbaY family lipoprotein [Sinobacterium caligoides]ROS00968.1 putative lipoprotein YbaY [Sinobacterium caligoides]